MNKKALLLMAVGLFLICVAILSCEQREVSASATADIVSKAAQDGGEEEDSPAQPSNAYCLLCHSQADRVWTLPSGESLSLTIDPTVLAASVHGEANPQGALACADCHVNYRFPHPRQTSQSVRQFKLERYAACRSCHEAEYLYNQDSVHGAALRRGKVEVAVCADCHGGHDIQPPDQPRQRISFTCGQCHGAVFEDYRNSVHGKALLEENNPDVPTCIDCHGVHNIQDPTTTLFRVRSPELCAQCHNDKDLMNKYDISTHVFESYLTDFHGTTVALFEQQDPDSPTNKAVCYDCHGVHNISPVDNHDTSAIRENLLTTCRQCHPDATANFPDAWIGHYEPTLRSNPLLSIVNTFYRLFIPFAIGLLGLFMATDMMHKIRSHWGDKG
jgi:predicted CXXCH cytochrome family protein